MIVDERTLEEMLSEPSEGTREVLAQTKGDFLVLGAGGKMGPTLAMMLRRATSGRKVFAVSRYSDRDVKARIEERGIETIEADLLDEAAYDDLPNVPNVFFLAGMKFGATGNQPLTWAMNIHVPALVARRYARSRIVALSTGNVYPFTDVRSAGSREEDAPCPVGEYAQSCLGRERMFQYFSQVHGTAATLIRLNYANEPRYGILVDLTNKILRDQPIDVTMGFVNVIWQGDANNYIAQSLSIAACPPTILNVAGPEVIRVRDLAVQIGRRLGKEPRFASQEAATALLSDSSLCVKRFGPPATPLDEMIAHVVDWVAAGKAVLNKPTKYDVRDGKF